MSTIKPAMLRYQQSMRRRRWLVENMPVLSERDVFYIPEDRLFLDDDTKLTDSSGQQLTVLCIEYNEINGTNIPHYVSVEENDGWLWNPGDIDIPRTLLAKGVELIPAGETFLFKKTTITYKPELPEI